MLKLLICLVFNISCGFITKSFGKIDEITRKLLWKRKITWFIKFQEVVYKLFLRGKSNAILVIFTHNTLLN